MHYTLPDNEAYDHILETLVQTASAAGNSEITVSALGKHFRFYDKFHKLFSYYTSIPLKKFIEQYPNIFIQLKWDKPNEEAVLLASEISDVKIKSHLTVAHVSEVPHTTPTQTNEYIINIMLRFIDENPVLLSTIGLKFRTEDDAQQPFGYYTTTPLKRFIEYYPDIFIQFNWDRTGREMVALNKVIQRENVERNVKTQHISDSTWYEINMALLDSDQIEAILRCVDMYETSMNIVKREEDGAFK